MTQENTPYDAVIADLEEKRDQLSATIEMLKALKGTASMVLPTAANAQRQQAEREIKRDSFFGMTLPEAVRKYLTMVKATKPNPELCAALLSGGFKTSSGNFAEVVRSTLQRNKDFVKVNGEWGLAEWYPGRGGGRKTRRTASEESPEETVDESSDGESSAS